MNEFYSIFAQCPLFEGIDIGDIESMLHCLGGRVVEMKKGQHILCEGDPTDQIGVILSGSVQMVREDYYGNRSVLSVIGPAQLFAEAYAFSEAKSLPVSIVSEDDGKVLMINSRRVATCCSNACAFHNQLIYNLLRTVSNKNLMLHQKIEVTSKRTTRQKLLSYLLYQAKLQNSNSFTIPFDRQALADYLEVDRSGLSVQISKLRDEGVLESEKNHFRLVNLENIE